ncbi:ribosome silencing factor [Olsenella sp. HMSC062G07]|uniref:ribosome silencing factor n=1 Tax=Olsenella sp. HMSC062G07 TaxID=1739330 RepID=UPI0008A2B229|nr:ribosome silencing factor [Olsenella sp. HMSC062G07]OFK24302.1 ribosome silencing factor RsfS [Olsenella sp. HMSC062G07]
MTMTSREVAKVAALAADDKKAADILLLDLTGLSDVCDYFLICTAQNNPQLDAIVDEVRQKVSANCGIKPLSSEGRNTASWVLIDYGSLVVHVFKPEARDYFRLERLWGEAPRVDLGLEGALSEPAAPGPVAG